MQKLAENFVDFCMCMFNFIAEKKKSHAFRKLRKLILDTAINNTLFFN
jgi:hypothetical protein